MKSLNILKGKVDFEACIVGRGVLKKITKLYIGKQFSNRVKIIDFVENPYPLMKQSNLFVLTSKFEGLPNVLLESLAKEICNFQQMPHRSQIYTFKW